MTLNQLNPVDFPFGPNVEGNVSNKDTSAWGIVNKLIELSKKWHVALASVFTSGGAGAYQDVTGLSQDVTPTYDDLLIVASAHLECEPAAATAAATIFRLVIGSDNGDDITIDNAASTNSYGVSLSHAFQGTEGTKYTVKVQVKDDATTAIKVNKGTLDVSFASVQG